MSERRSRTYEWVDPNETARGAMAMSGREFFDAWLTEHFQVPIAMTLGFEITEVGDGRATVTLVPEEYHYNPIGTVHGGVAATLLDTATGIAIHSKLAKGQGYTTLSLNVNYLRPMTAQTGLVTAVGTVTSLGRRVAVAEAELKDQSDKLIARGTATCLILTTT